MNVYVRLGELRFSQYSAQLELADAASLLNDNRRLLAIR